MFINTLFSIFRFFSVVPIIHALGDTTIGAVYLLASIIIYRALFYIKSMFIISTHLVTVLLGTRLS